MDDNKQPLDTASEPVKETDDADFMDTGLLHEKPKPKADEAKA